jgi:MoaD family protein
MPVVKFFANLRQVTGLKEKTVAGNSLSQVLAALERDYPALSAFLSNASGKRLIITINGHPLDPAVGWDVPLAETDQVAIFPPIAGG